MKLLIRQIDGEWWINAKQLGELIVAAPMLSAEKLLSAIRDAMARGLRRGK